MIKRTTFAQRLVREGRKGHKGIRVSESYCVSPAKLFGTKILINIRVSLRRRSPSYPYEEASYA